jgi:predicted outer membrane protein
LTAAVSLALGSFTFAQQREPAAGTGAAGAATAQPSGAASAYGAQPARAAGGAMEQQLQQIAQDPNTAADKLFVLKAGHESLMCQAIAQQVASKAQNAEVKKLAQQHVQDERQCQQKLQTVAQSLQIQLPQQLSPKEQQIVQIFSSIPADQLEKHFVAGAHVESTASILALQSCAQLSQNDAIKKFAQEALPMLQQQHQQTMAVAQQLGIPTGMEAITAGARIGPDSSSTPPSRSDTPGSATPGAGRSDTPPAATPGAPR